MIQFRFYIDDLEIDQPMGFDEIVIEMNRDEQFHGVFFEASTSDLRFYGEAADYLREKKETLGLKSEVIFLAESKCEGEDNYVEMLRGKLNFRRYKEGCGNDCYVSLNVEQDSCLMTMRNRFDQQVEMERNTAFDNISALQPYSALNFDLELPAKELEARVEGYSLNDTNEIQAVDYPDNRAWGINVRPTYADERFNSINQGQLVPFSNYTQLSLLIAQPMSPQLLYDDIESCFSDEFQYTFRFKGRWRLNTNATGFTVHAFVNTWDGSGDNMFNDSTVIHDEDVYPGPSSYAANTEYDFDVTITGSMDLTAGIGLYGFLQFSAFDSDDQEFILNIEFDPETYVLIVNNKICPPTTSKVSAVHETLSRVTEAITNNCLKVKSEYYGRTDSEPYTSLVDGCGSLRVLTSGLHIRKGENARFFASLKELFEGLKAIDNIGMGLEPNPFIDGYDWLRIEDVDYFYQDDEVLRLPFVPGAEIAIDESKHYSLIKVGYKKWEVERVNGLDEPNSNKQYRTSLTAVNNTLDITSNLVAGSYPIEVTRQQSFATSGGADTKYDNEIFIICVDRAAYGFSVEQGNAGGGGVYASAFNVYSPETLYNWRIRPFYNLMRWFKSIANSYTNLVDTANKLFFASGTGNFLAEGELIEDTYDASGCKLENGSKAENDDLGINDFLNEVEGTPLWKPELAKVSYPLSVRDYRLLKESPYKYLSFQCGTSDTWIKGYVKQMQYKPTKGQAEFSLILKWD